MALLVIEFSSEVETAFAGSPHETPTGREWVYEDWVELRGSPGPTPMTEASQVSLEKHRHCCLALPAEVGQGMFNERHVFNAKLTVTVVSSDTATASLETPE